MADINLLDKENYFKIGGIIHHIRERVYNNITTKYLMIEDCTNPQYPNYFEVEFYDDKCNLVENIKAGDFAQFSVNIGGRKWIDKNTNEVKGTFFSFRGWKVDNHTPNQFAQPQQAQAPQMPQQTMPQQAQPMPQVQQPQQWQQPQMTPPPQANFSQGIDDQVPF